MVSITLSAYKLAREQVDFLGRFGFTPASGGIPHTHPVSALLRNAFEDYVVRQHKNLSIKDVGGNYARHARYKDRSNIHCCCPYTCPADVIREVSRDYGNPSMENYCRNKFTECSAAASVYMFNHSMYYISQAELLCIPVGSTIYSLHHRYPGSGTYCASEMDVLMEGNSVTVTARGNGTPYVHDNCWLSGECVIPGINGSVIAFKLMAAYETALMFKGKVMALPNPTSHYMNPIPVAIDVQRSRLHALLKAEIVGTTIDAKTVHVLHMRAKTISITEKQPLPDNITHIITDVINNAAYDVIEMQHNMDLHAVEDNNRVVSDVLEKLVPAEISIFRRFAGGFISATGGVLRVAHYMATIPLAAAYKSSVNFTKYAVALHRGMKYTTNNSGIIQAHTFVPSRNWENELCSIVNRAIPPDLFCVISPNIVRAAELLAGRIGKVILPVDFETWLMRYPEKRRIELRKASLRPPNASVQMFIKIEQLDKQSDPRAIQARHDAFKAFIGPWVTAFEERCREVLPFFVKGMAPQDTANKRAKLRERAYNMLEVDFTRFDRHCSKQLLMATEHLIFEMCFPEDIASMLSQQLDNSVFSHFGAEYSVEGTRMSGDMTTSIGNCLIVASLMLAAGLPLDSMLIEGDDMLAAVTDEERENVHIEVITATGMKPKCITTIGGGTFCSRFDVIDSEGYNKCVRHPLRDLTRFGYHIREVDKKEAVLNHAIEWNGIPMLGLVYLQALEDIDPEEKNNPFWIRKISAIARAKFTTTFDIGHDLQVAFESDPESRQRIYEFLHDARTAETDAELPPPEEEKDKSSDGHAESEVPGIVAPSNGGGDENSPVPARRIRPSTSGPTSRDVRDVQDTRSDKDSIQDCSGHDNERRINSRNRLRFKRLHPVLHRDRRTIAKEHRPRLAGPDADSAPRTGHEATLAHNIKPCG